MTAAPGMDGLSADCCEMCQSAAGPEEPVTWSPAFGQHLCANCRDRRTDSALYATEKSGQPRPSSRGASAS